MVETSDALAEYVKLWPRWIRPNELFAHDPVLPVLTQLPPVTPELLARLPHDVGCLAAYVENARDVPLFVLDGQMALDAVDSSDEMPLNLLPLPPLPFPSLTVELAGKAPVMQLATQEAKLLALLITERRQGEVWLVQMLSLPITSTDLCAVTVYEIQAGGLIRELDGSYQPLDGWRSAERSPHVGAPIEWLHLITARGVHREPLPRPVRRSYERKSGKPFPKNTWRIRIGSGGGGNARCGASHSHRGPTVRFMVCGHWRYLDASRRTWIRPYIKGPTGAPWRRPKHPVRVLETVTD